MDEVRQTFDDVKIAVDKYQGNHDSRAELLHSIKKLQIAVEGPTVYASTLRFEVMHAVCLYVANQQGLLAALVAHRRNAVTAKDLSAETGCDELLVVRTMRVLVGIGIGDEIGYETYASNAVAEYLQTKPELASLEFGARLLWPLVGDIARYTQEDGLVQFPSGPSEKTPFDAYFGGSLWDVLARDMQMKKMYDNYMTIRKYGLDQSWYDIFPAAEHLSRALDKSTQEAREQRIVLVDVGGGQGQDICRFLRSTAGQFDEQKFVLEDLPETLGKIEPLPQNVEARSHDFFKPQPVKGALIYYYHNIFHDFSDDLCLELLKNTREAMSADSILLIHDFVLRDRLPQRRACLVDWTMLFHAAGVERSLTQWQKLISKSGLDLVKIWSPDGEGESVLELKLKV